MIRTDGKALLPSCLAMQTALQNYRDPRAATVKICKQSRRVHIVSWTDRDWIMPSKDNMCCLQPILLLQPESRYSTIKMSGAELDFIHWALIEWLLHTRMEPDGWRIEK